MQLPGTNSTPAATHFNHLPNFRTGLLPTPLPHATLVPPFARSDVSGPRTPERRRTVDLARAASEPRWLEGLRIDIPVRDCRKTIVPVPVIALPRVSRRQTRMLDGVKPDWHTGRTGSAARVDERNEPSARVIAINSGITGARKASDPTPAGRVRARQSQTHVSIRARPERPAFRPVSDSRRNPKCFRPSVTKSRADIGVLRACCEGIRHAIAHTTVTPGLIRDPATARRRHERPRQWHDQPQPEKSPPARRSSSAGCRIKSGGTKFGSS